LAFHILISRSTALQHMLALAKYGKRNTLTIIILLVMLTYLTGVPKVSASETNTASLAPEQSFTQAAQEFGVPKQLLMAISYNQSRWQSHGASASINGGYGLMNLTSTVPTEDGRGRGPILSHSPNNIRTHTLDEAAKLLNQSPENLKSDNYQNVRGAAAVLAQYAKQLHNNTLPANLADWYDVTAKFSSSTSSQSATEFANNVYTTLGHGASVKTTNSNLQLEATPNIKPQVANIQKLNLPANNSPMNQTKTNGDTECPYDLNCRFIPAGYAQNSSDPADYGNYDHANRPQDMQIKYIVIHDTEGSYQSAIDHFQDTKSYVSCNYIVRSSDGAVTQMVRNQDVSWCAGDWYVNMHSINIEHEGFAAQGATWYTEEMYQSSAKLVRYLAQKYHVPLDREHIVGHDNIPTIAPDRLGGQHWDPGPYWDWNHYMALLHRVSDDQERWMESKPTGNNQTVTILPNFSKNQPKFTDCSTAPCITLPAQGSNTVQLHTQPNNNSPLLSDPYLHSNNSPGTNQVNDWGAQAAAGQRYAVADQKNNWTGIWYGGKIGWFYNPNNQPTAVKSRSVTITPRAGRTSIPVYGAAYPDATAYPSGVPVQVLDPLYTMPAGQEYAAITDRLPTDYFYDATINYSLPHDHEIIKSQDGKYYQITFNKRIAYVKTSDVDIKWW
jgi:N-acetyl-anhydromuramyl-L-alanine amidase AmpD